MFEKLGLGAQNAQARCEAFIAEEAGVVALRFELMSEQKLLESVQRALFNFGL